MQYLVLLIFLLAWSLSFAFPHLAHWGSGVHSLCLSLAPQSEWQSFYQAIVCGKKLPASLQLEQMRTLGIIHLLVVSGFHLCFFSKILKFLFFNRLPFIFENFFLFVFVLTCQFQAPALRAWCCLILNNFNQKKKLFLKPSALLFVAVIFCLCLNRDFFYGMSLPLSWLACIGLSFGKNNMTRSFFCFLFLQPIISQWGAPSLLTIGINAFLTPVFALVLFPASLFCFLLPFLSPVVDQCWRILFFFTENISTELTLFEPQDFFGKRLWIWIYALGLNLVLIFWEFCKGTVEK